MLGGDDSFQAKTKRTPRVVVEELSGSIDDKEPFFMPKCECGWLGSVWPTTEKNEAFAKAYSHDSNVSDELTYSVHEPDTCSACFAETQ